MHGGFGLGDGNGGRATLLDFAKAFELMIVISYFPKEDHFVTLEGLDRLLTPQKW